ncbi:2-oxoacid:acceptor oxidoreductase family protein [Methylomarinum vadi]|uniref:2-oxoacid:acceptor oxidoreductase family protein n=1 Tax=Methylomarinum vadi TaxID=438855 RepID=UPI000AB1C747|nr:2-oxoacid:acceptor oxidoreductase family protein [Methylomarinum vadi]
MAIFGKTKENKTFKYPGIRVALDGNSAVVMCERESSDAAGAFPITPASAMGEYWAEAVNNGHLNISNRPLIFIQPEGEHAAAGMTAGLSLSGLRASNFSASQGIAYMHESLYAAVGKRLPYVLNIATRAITKSSLNVHCGHDDYHCIDDTGFIQVFGNSAQAVADLNIIGRKIAELSLNPIAVAQDGFLTSHLIEPLNLPERELIEEFLGLPDDIIPTPTPAQRILYGETRRRIPINWDVDRPLMTGTVTNQDAYMQSTAAQRPYFFDHVADFADQCMDEWYQLTGRRYCRVGLSGHDNGDYLIVGQGSVTVAAAAVAHYLQETRGLKISVADMTMFRPFPGDLIGKIVKGRKGVLVLERTDQPLAEDLPLMREIRATIGKCLENGRGKGEKPFPKYESYKKAEDAPELYSGSFGLGSRDLQPGDLIAAVENMLPDGGKKKFFYLGIEFTRDTAYSPKQEIQMQQVEEAYPGIRNLALKRAENPNLLPQNSLTIRMHSVGGWGAITTGKNLAMTLFDLLGYDIKANPKYGSEKKGQPTTYYLSVSPEPIHLNCEYHHVNVVLSPDPNVFTHANPLFGLDAEGTLIIQSALDSDEEVWRSFPRVAQQYIVDKKIKVFYIDAFKIAREEATEADLQFRMQGIAFQGAFFQASPIAENAGKTHDEILESVHQTLKAKFGHKGEQVVEDNFRIVKRGFDETHELNVAAMTVGDVHSMAEMKSVSTPIMLRRRPANDDAMSDVHRFWDQTGFSYASGQGSKNLADPFMATSAIPAATGIYRDMTSIRQEHPRWIPENCTACGDCFSLCPDTAIPGLINTVGEVFETNIKRIEKQGHGVKHLRRAIRNVERKYHALTADKSEGTNLTPILAKAIGETIKEYPEAERAEVSQEFDWFKDAMGDFKFALVKPYHDAMNKRQPNSGGLYSITIDPYACKGCLECVKECEDGALEAVTQTPESIAQLREDWDYWLDLPTSNPKFDRIDDIDEKIGALHTLMQDKSNYHSLPCGDGACTGCGEKSVIHLFTSTVTAVMQPRVQKHVARIQQLIDDMEKHIRLKLAENLDIGDVEAIESAIEQNQSVDLTLSKLSIVLDDGKPTQPIDKQWLKWATQLVAKLKHLKWQYVEGITGEGRAAMGISNSTGCTSVWGSTFPYNPYPFPWTNHLFQDSPSVAMGLFEGHMVKMAEGFKAIRMAELEITGKYDKDEHDIFFRYFDWRQFSEEEYKLCPPVVCIGGDGAMYDIGFQNLSRALMSGTPIKVLVLDTQVYSNTGGQACTSGFIGQVADMAPYGENKKGKQEKRKEMALISMAHRTSYVLQSAQSHLNHLLEGYIDGLNYQGPAIWNIYSVCQPEHGVGDDMSTRQSKLAVESRAYPLTSFDPNRGTAWKKCLSLKSNPDLDKDWTTYMLNYVDEYGNEESMELPLTFADWALTEGRFRKHFNIVPQEKWNDDMVPLHEFIDLDEDDRDDKYPYIWALNPNNNNLIRVLVANEIVESTIERREYWRMLKGLVGEDEKIDPQAIADNAKAEAAQSLVAGLMNLATGGSSEDLLKAITSAPATVAAKPAAPAPAAPAASAAAPEPAAPAKAAGGYEPVWIDTPDCTTCDECVDINPKIFQYNADKKAIVVDPTAGTYEDIVRAAEKCTAVIIHPGTPWNPDEPNLDKLIKRAEKFQ